MFNNVKQFLAIAALLLIAAGAQPVGAAFWQWSTTPANNANADPTINWSEGMSPSSVNDSARAMMAVLAAYRLDNGGGLTTGGTSTAYTLTTNQPFASTADLSNQTLAFIITPTNGVSATLNVNGIGAIPLVTENGAPIAAGTLRDGRLYHVTYNLSNNVFRVHDQGDNVYNVALGAIMWSTLATPPNANFIAPSGQCISTTTYATYWVALGSPASGTCPGGQFAVIDMRGRVAAALDTLNASAASRLTSASTGCGTAMTSVGAVCANGLEGRSLTVAQIPSLTSSGSTALSVTVTGTEWQAGSTSDSTGVNPGSSGGAGLTSSLTGGSISKKAATGSTSGTMTSTTSGTTGAAHPTVMPTIGLIPYLRVL